MKELKHLPWKKIPKWFVVALGIAFLVGTLIGYSQIPTSAIIFSSGIYPGAPTYTIWREGGYYYAKNSIGRLDYSDGNATRVILNAIGVGQRAIFLAAGTYRVDSTIVLRSNLILYGEGKATKIEQIGASGYSGIYGEDVSNVTVKNLWVAGNKASGLYSGIEFHSKTIGCKNILVENTYVCGFGDVGIIHGTSGPPPYGEHIIFTNNFVWDNIFGISLGGVGDGIISNNFAYANNGSYILEYGYKNTIEGNMGIAAIVGSGQDGIYIGYVDDYIAANNQILNQKRHGIWVDHSNRGIIIGNIIKENTLTGITVGSSFNVTIANNIVMSNGSWGIEESGTSNYSVILGNTVTLNANGIKKIGASTKVNLCWNQTNWLP